MLTCIACSKQQNPNNGGSKDEEEDDDRTPRSKQTIKSLTSQVHTILLLLLCHFHEMVKRKETARQDLFWVLSVSVLEAQTKIGTKLFCLLRRIQTFFKSVTFRFFIYLFIYLSCDSSFLDKRHGSESLRRLQKLQTVFRFFKPELGCCISFREVPLCLQETWNQQKRKLYS